MKARMRSDDADLIYIIAIKRGSPTVPCQVVAGWKGEHVGS
jgi:hypothetical protein